MPVGDAEKFLLLQKDAIQLALARLLVRKKVKRVEDLMDLYQISGMRLLCFHANGGFSFLEANCNQSYNYYSGLVSLSVSHVSIWLNMTGVQGETDFV